MMPADPTTLIPVILIALVVLVIAVWAFSRATRKARVIDADGAPSLVRDVLAEGAAPAPRNQALIDAPRAVEDATAAPAAPSAAPLGADEEPAPDTAPAPSAPPAPPAPPAGAAADDLTRIKGLGPKIAALLGELGVTTFAQIAAWTPEEAARIDAKMGRFSGRITRDQWVEQARLLAAGDETAFAAQFGNNG